MTVAWCACWCTITKNTNEKPFVDGTLYLNMVAMMSLELKERELLYLLNIMCIQYM